MDLLFTPAKLGTCELKNRIVRSATNEHLSDEKGQVTPLWADTLIELAKNEVGLVITGHFCVDKMQRADAGQPVLDETTDESLLRRACDGVHRYGGKLFFQLSHSGIKGVESVNGAPPKHPEDFTREELDRLVEQFAFAAWTERRSAASTSTAARGRRRRSIWTRSSASRTLPQSSKAARRTGANALPATAATRSTASALCAACSIKTRSSSSKPSRGKEKRQSRRILRRFCFHCSMTLYHVKKMEKRANLEFYRHYRLHCGGSCPILK